MERIYFDAVSSTKVDDEVLKTYIELLNKHSYNSDALYDEGVALYDMQEKSRKLISELLNVDSSEVLFTSSASEANSTAIKSVCLAQKERKHIITTITEHHSLYYACKQMEEVFGYDVTYLKPDKNGCITANDVKKYLRNDTILVSIMACNNELGLIYDVEEIAKVVKSHPGTYFHSDLTQAIGKLKIDLTNIDLASFSAHKIHGLKGSACLIKKRHVPFIPLINGGQQEFGYRGGTSNALENIVLAKTLRLALQREEIYKTYLKELHDYFVNELNKIPEVKINSFEKCLDTLINISTPIQSEVLVNALNLKGIMVSSKSTCGSRKNDPNETLKAMGIDENYAIRISYDYTNNKEEITYFIETLKEIISKYG